MSIDSHRLATIVFLTCMGSVTILARVGGRLNSNECAEVLAFDVLMLAVMFGTDVLAAALARRRYGRSR